MKLRLIADTHGNDLEKIKKNTTAQLLEKISKICKFEKWFFGHHYIDIKTDKYIGLWKNDYILEVQIG